MTALLEEQFDASDIAEVHWNTNMILAVFFAASLISAVFFGLGYSFGRGGTAKPVLDAASSNSPTRSDLMQQQTFGTAALRSEPVSTPTTAQQTSQSHPQLAGQISARPVLRPVSTAASLRTAAIPNRELSRLAPIAAEKHVAIAHKDSTADAAARYMVQIGAVGDQKDARRLVSQLRKQGFHAGIYPATHDKFLHVQIGPFRDVQQAQVMRHHVMASGYRAILKRAS